MIPPRSTTFILRQKPSPTPNPTEEKLCRTRSVPERTPTIRRSMPMAQQAAAKILVGPRFLEDRVCRLMYRAATDEAWTEEWRKDGWVRTQALVRDVIGAPTAQPGQLRRRGIPMEKGAWDREEIRA